jgi:hypothetical protein
MVMRCAPDVPAVTGETIALSIDPVRAHLFDAEGYRVGA